MKKLAPFLIFILILGNIAKSQDTILKFKSVFKVNPFSLVDWHNQAFTIAYERVISHKSLMPFTWQIEAGPIILNYAFPNDFYRGFKTRFEIRYYSTQYAPKTKPGEHRQFFVGMNTGYNQVWYKTTMSYSPTGNGSSWSGIHKLKEVTFVKRVNTVNLLLGFIKPVNNRLIFEIFGGVGTRRTNIKSITKGYHMLGWQPDSQFDMSGYYTEAGKFNYINFTGGLKFGFKLN
ncbi:MAG: hypothetical protein ACKVQB_12310 [Bacteroidia bacterium]